MNIENIICKYLYIYIYIRISITFVHLHYIYIYISQSLDLWPFYKWTTLDHANIMRLTHALAPGCCWDLSLIQPPRDDI